MSRRLATVGEIVRDHVLRELRRQSSESLSAIAFETAADKIYVIDRSVETALLPALVEHLQPALSFALICEGVNDEQPLIFPAGTPIDECRARLIVDPIDGTRPIMYNKRSAWWLAGLAPNRGDETRSEILTWPFRLKSLRRAQRWLTRSWRFGAAARAARRQI